MARPASDPVASRGKIVPLRDKEDTLRLSRARGGKDEAAFQCNRPTARRGEAAQARVFDIGRFVDMPSLGSDALLWNRESRSTGTPGSISSLPASAAGRTPNSPSTSARDSTPEPSAKSRCDSQRYTECRGGMRGLAAKPVLVFGKAILVAQPEQFPHPAGNQLRLARVGRGVIATEQPRQPRGLTVVEIIIRARMGGAAAVVLQLVARPDHRVSFVERKFLRPHRVLTPEEPALPGERAGGACAKPAPVHAEFEPRPP